jgi:hypothetical protein
LKTIDSLTQANLKLIADMTSSQQQQHTHYTSLIDQRDALYLEDTTQTQQATAEFNEQRASQFNEQLNSLLVSINNFKEAFAASNEQKWTHY